MSTGEPVDVPEPELAEEPDFAEESDSVQADSVQGGEEQEAAESEVAESEVAESPFPVQTLKFDGDTPAKADDSADAIVSAIMAGVPEEEGEDADGDAAGVPEAEGDGDANGDEATPSREAEGAGDAESPADASEMPNLPKRATPAFSYFLRDKYGSRPSREAGDAWKLLGEEEKGKYVEQHATDKARYEAEKEVYKRYLADHPELGAAAAAAADELDPGGSVLPLAKVTLARARGRARARVGVRVRVRGEGRVRGSVLPLPKWTTRSGQACIPAPPVCNPPEAQPSQPVAPRDQVKRMMRLANMTPTTSIAKDALFLVSKSAETFLQMLTEQSVHFARAGKRKKVRASHRSLHRLAHRSSPSTRSIRVCTCMRTSYYVGEHSGPGAPLP
jgi:histone H3/H4